MAKLSIVQLKSVVHNYVVSNKISVDSFTESRDNSVALLDTLGKIYTLWQTYGDKLSMFDGEDLSFGKTIEEWAQDLILPEDFDANGSTTMAPHVSTYRPVSFSYTLGKKTIPQTIITFKVRYRRSFYRAYYLLFDQFSLRIRMNFRYHQSTPPYNTAS